MASETHTEYQNITIETVDRAVYDWFDRDVNAHVRSPEEELKKVPVVFASGERWSTARDPRGIRDKNGVLILPIISVRRTNIDRDRNVALALGTETDTLTISKRLDRKTNILQNAIEERNPARRAANDKAVYEVTTIPFPEWFTTGYEIVVQTQYITQMNDILGRIFASIDVQNSFLMPVHLSTFEDLSTEERSDLTNYYFVGFMDTSLSDTGNFEEFTDTERIVKYSFNLTIPTYLQLDPEGKRPAIQRKYTAYEVSFSDERVCFIDDPSELDDIFKIGK